MKDQIKEVIAKILYLSSSEEIDDDMPLFTELGLSSIDYIDLCYELQQKFGSGVTPEKLWPINNMMLDKECFDNSQWTREGLEKIASILNVANLSKDLSLRDLYRFFTVNFIQRRVEILS